MGKEVFKAFGLMHPIKLFKHFTTGEANGHPVLTRAHIDTDTDFERDPLSPGLLLQRDPNPDAHPRVSSIYRATIKEMGTIPIDPLDDAGNEGGISGSSL
jgi:hypothetical protein